MGIAEDFVAEMHFYEPKKGHGLRHDPFRAIVAPRPIGWISTVAADGVVNLAPYSYFNAVSSAPPMLMFSVGGEKDTLVNVRASGEFVAHMVSKELAVAMNATSARVESGVDEMALAGLEREASTLVAPPRVKDAPAAFECKVVSVVPLTLMDGQPAGSTLIVGQVVGAHIDLRLIKDGLFDTAGAGLIARCGYRGDYALISSLFEMLRPADKNPYD